MIDTFTYWNDGMTEAFNTCVPVYERVLQYYPKLSSQSMIYPNHRNNFLKPNS